MYRTIIEYGFSEFIAKLKLFTKKRIREFKWQKVFSEKSLEARFTRIYNEKLWTGSESASGYGSGIEYTRSLRKYLQLIIENYEISKIFDMACGDCNWIKNFFETKKIEYLGCDIVRALIEKNTELYGGDLIKFEVLDVVSDNLPSADLVICRDVLFHLPNRDILTVLSKICATQSKYLLVTTHINDSKDQFSNVDIDAGDFRRIDLFEKPFSFPRESILTFNDWMAPDPPRMMALYDVRELRKSWLL